MGNATLEKEIPVGGRMTISKMLVEPTHSSLLQLVRFGLTGVLAMICDYSVMLSLFKFAHLNHALAVAAGYSVGLVVCYLLSIYWIFPSRNMSDPKKEFTIFVIIGVVGLGLTEIIVHYVLMALDANAALAERFDRAVLLSGARFVAIVIVFFFNFVARKALLFRGARQR